MKPMTNDNCRTILSAIWLSFAVSVAVLVNIEVSAAPALSCPIPLEKGTQWTYEGTVRWTPVNSGANGPIHIQWVTAVLDLVTNQSARAAVV
jgi:hypothetical protein